MDTYKTLDQARSAKGQIAQCILEIEHSDAGICFIGSKAPMSLMQAALKAKPMPEIIRVIAEHSTMTDAQIEAIANEHRKCERCGDHVPASAYHQTEKSQWGPVGELICRSKIF